MAEERMKEFFFEEEPKVKLHKKKSSDDPWYKRLFSFYYDVDLSDECSVLYRRNLVIRRISTILNIILLIFAFVGITKSNYILTLVFFIVTTTLSFTVAFMLNGHKRDYAHQKRIMIVQSIFMYINSLLLYIKTIYGFKLSNEWGTNEVLISEATYTMILVSLFVMSLYQNKKLALNMFIYSFIVFLVLNIVTLHPSLGEHAYSIPELFKYIVIDEPRVIIDIILRTIAVLCIYVIIYYSIIYSSNMFDQRSGEYKRRIQIEESYRKLVDSVFELISDFNGEDDSFEKRIEASKTASLAYTLSEAFGFDRSESDALREFASCHYDYAPLLKIERDVKNYPLSELVDKSQYATEILKRFEFLKKAEDMVINTFIYPNYKVIPLRMTVSDQTIILADIYSTLRSEKVYKKAYTHLQAVDYINTKLSQAFHVEVMSRFNKYSNEVNSSYTDK